MAKLLILLLFFIAGCSSLPHEAENVAKFFGEKAYFTRPVEISLPEDSQEKYATEKVFKSCEPVKILKLETLKEDDLYAYFGIHFQQNGNFFYSEKLDQSPIIGLKSQNYRLRNFQKYFHKNLPFRPRKVYMAEIKKEISSKRLMCGGVIWTKMTRREFLFVKGRPSKINIPSSARENREEWLYAFSKDPSENQIYIFKNGLLESWRPINPNDTSKK